MLRRPEFRALYKSFLCRLLGSLRYPQEGAESRMSQCIVGRDLIFTEGLRPKRRSFLLGAQECVGRDLIFTEGLRPATSGVVPYRAMTTSEET